MHTEVMKLWAAQFVLATALVTSTASATQKVLGGVKENPLNSEIHELVIDALHEWHIPGLSIAVIDGKNTWTAVSQLHFPAASDAISWFGWLV